MPLNCLPPDAREAQKLLNSPQSRQRKNSLNVSVRKFGTSLSNLGNAALHTLQVKVIA
jgi:hypothetical protein